jgi:ribosome-associated protein
VCNPSWCGYAEGVPEPIAITDHISLPDTAIRVVTSRSGGPGGQNVNTRETRVQIFVDLSSSGLHPAVLARLQVAHPGKLTQAGELLVACQTHRSQDANLAEARERVADMIRAVLVPPKRRRPTRPSRGAKERRLEAKSQRSETKRDRSKPQE